MLNVFFQGFVIGMALIVPIGPQNIIVMNQGIKREYFLFTASVCFISDLILICIAIFGGSVVITKYPLIMLMITILGIIFLSIYGTCSLIKSWKGNIVNEKNKKNKSGNIIKVLLTVLAVTWLNPHVYLDTLVILGSVSSQVPLINRNWFAIGTIIASLIWFYGLAIISAYFSPWLIKDKIQRIIQCAAGIIMWVIALQLVKQCYYNQFLINLFNK